MPSRYLFRLMNHTNGPKKNPMLKFLLPTFGLNSSVSQGGIKFFLNVIATIVPEPSPSHIPVSTKSRIQIRAPRLHQPSDPSRHPIPGPIQPRNNWIPSFLPHITNYFLFIAALEIYNPARLFLLSCPVLNLLRGWVRRRWRVIL